MKKEKKSFEQDLAMGKRIEKHVRIILKSVSGLHLIPIPSDGNRGARVYSDDLGGFDLPAHDMIGGFAGQTFDVQVKGKGYSPFYRNWNSYMHGIDLPVYEQYTTGKNLTGRKLWMIFVEIFQGNDGPGYTPSAVAQFWNNLPQAQKSEPSPAFPEGGAFWPRAAFAPIINTTVRPPQLIESKGVSNAQLMLRREFLSTMPDTYWCRRCGGSDMFIPTGAQTKIWMCMRCDKSTRYAPIERRTFAKPSRDQVLMAAFKNAGWLYAGSGGHG